MNASAQLSCSVIIPVYSGEKYLPALVQELEQLGKQWQNENCPVRFSGAIFVLDNAIDGSDAVLDRLAAEYSWINVVRLSRNFGQHPATQAGILHSSSDWIVTLDEDLQHRPAMINHLFRKVAESGCDIVYAKPRHAVHQSLFRDLGSRGYKWLIERVTGNKSISHFNSFRLVRGTVARSASSVCSHSTYFDIALSWFSEKLEVEPLDLVDERYVKGKASGYSVVKLFSHARRMVLSAQVKALRVGLFAGLFGLLFSIGYGIYILTKQFVFGILPPIAGWSSLMVASLFYGGIITLMIGILTEFISIIILHIQGKPVFFVIDRTSDKLLLPYFARK